MESSKRAIVVYHIGGEGDYGPIMPMISLLGKEMHLVVFEARSNTEDTEIITRLSESGMQTTLITVGIDQNSGSMPFNVNKFPLSSSLLACSALAADENPGYAHCHKWRENAELSEVIWVKCEKIDNLVEQGMIPRPDVISIDAQGAELRILLGAQKTLEKVLCVVTEVEFFEIYESQGLFDDQMALLTKYGFRLLNVLNVQHWHPGPAIGNGFMTVGEAVFLRYATNLEAHVCKRGYIPYASLGTWELIRLALIAYSFGSLGYVYSLGKEIERREPGIMRRLPSDGVYKVIPELINLMDEHKDRYNQDPLYYIKNFRVR